MNVVSRTKQGTQSGKYVFRIDQDIVEAGGTTLEKKTNPPTTPTKPNTAAAPTVPTTKATTTQSTPKPTVPTTQPTPKPTLPAIQSTTLSQEDMRFKEQLQDVKDENHRHQYGHHQAVSKSYRSHRSSDRVLRGVENNWTTGSSRRTRQRPGMS